jgi:hypothetical protein
LPTGLNSLQQRQDQEDYPDPLQTLGAQNALPGVGRAESLAAQLASDL